MTRVLIVDDDAVNLYLLRALLQGHGHIVDEARHGAEALTKARQVLPALIISDLLMPVLDGYSLLRHWRADDLLKTIPFVVYTATYTEPKDRRLAMSLGADAFIVKPAEPEQFMACIGDILDKASRGELPASVEQPVEESILLSEYNEVLIRKLEKKALQLEQSNRELLTEVAERKQAEKALRESEERYRNLFHSISDPLFVYDRDTLAYLAVNDAAVANYGYSRDEFLCMTVKDIRPPEDVSPLPPSSFPGGEGGVWDPNANCAANATAPLSPRGREVGGEGANSQVSSTPSPPAPLPQGERGENGCRLGHAVSNNAQAATGDCVEKRGVWRHRKKNGEIIEVEISAYRVDFSGRPACVIQARDITEANRSQAEAAYTSDLLRAIADGTPDALFVKDQHGRYMLCNAAAAHFIGKPVEAIIGKDDAAFFAAEDVGDVMASDRLVMTSNQTHVVEESLDTVRGRRMFQTVKVPYRNRLGEVLGVIGVARDITEQKQAEESLRLRDRAIQEVSQGIIITDPRQADNPIIYASAGVERITGYSQAELLGKNCRIFQGKDTDRDTVRKLREAILAGHGCTAEILNYRKNGTPFWNSMSMNPVRDDNGELAYFVGVQNDITDRRMLEDQLRQSQKMEAVGRLAGGVAHDFNNLLTIITGYSELLLVLPNLGAEMRDSVHAIIEASSRAAGLTRQLLGFSRQTILQPKILDLNAVVVETGKLLRRLIGEDILFSTVLSPDLHPVRVDPGQLDQVLMNLCVNARDAMPRGGKLTIETANVELSEEYASTQLGCKAGHYAMLAISDSGCGMTPEVMARIFEPFFTTKDIGKGTGLGLAMVFGIVQQSDGFIHVYSEPGHGTTFKIYFPVIAEQANNKSEPASAFDVRGTETILLVEDEDGVRGLASMSLQLHGYKVLTAVDGKDAMRVVHAHREPLDLVLTDVVMPNVSGPELVRKLKEIFPRVKVLFMSGYTDDAVVRHGLLEAEIAFIQKPYTPLGLARKVRQVLDAPLSLPSTTGRD